MAFADTTWYCNFGNGSSTGHYAVAQFAASHAYSAGQIIRQLTAPAVGSERCFVCIVAGTSGTEPSWTLTRGAKNTSTTPVFQECTGSSALNGDLTNTPDWTTQKAAGTPTLGAMIKRNNGASFQICSTAGTLGSSEPAFSNTAGTTTTEGTTTWTSLGAVSNFTGGQAPHARIANACAASWFAAGNTIYVGDNHAETQATAITINPTGSASTVAKILCHNHSGSYPPTSLTTGATVTTSAAVGITLSGATAGIYVYGVALVAGSGASSAASITFGTNTGGLYLDNCSVQILSTGASTVQLGASTAGATLLTLNNTPFKFGAVGSSVNFTAGIVTWMNTAPGIMSGSSTPTTLFNLNSSGTISSLVVEAVDLSSVAGVLAYNNSMDGVFLFKDCKLNASATFATPSSAGYGPQLVRCDSGATSYKSARYAYEGTETTETTITRVGGASDPTGQAQSRKIVTTANAQWLRPFKGEPYAIWNPTTGSNVTVTVYGTVNSYYIPNNDEIWLDVEYLGSSSSPLGTIVTTTKASLVAAPAAVTADDSVWNGASLLAASEPSPRTTYLSFDGPSSNVTMSNSNRTVTHPNTSAGGVNSADFAGPAVGQLGVKQYFEVTLQTSILNGNSIGYMTPTDTAATSPSTAGANKTGVVLGSSSSIIYSPNGVSTGKDLGAVAVNDVIGVAWDADNSLVWFRKNGGNWNNDGSANPATGAGGVVPTIRQGYTPYVSFASGGSSTDVMAANFGQTSFAFTAPSGFSAPDATGGGGGGGVAGWSSFKLVAVLSSPQPGLAGYIHARVRAGKPSATYYIDPKVVLT